MMALFPLSRRVKAVCFLVISVALIAFGFRAGLAPAKSDAATQPILFQLKSGEGFRTVMTNLKNEGLIRSSIAAGTYALVTGSAMRLQAGSYRLSPAMSAVAILDELTSGRGREVTVTIPEGKNKYEIDAILSGAGVIAPGELIAFTKDNNLEGKLFPDTYRFFTQSDVRDVAQKFLDTFDLKAGPLLAADPKHAVNDLIVASLIEKEVSDPRDQAIVSGIIWKRERAGMPLQVDATLCYARWVNRPPGDMSPPSCKTLDTKVVSEYNTYLNKGFPPAPIGNPGISAIQAALHPETSPYWYYLSDPKTGKTIFAKTLDEQHQNTVKYLVND